MTIVRAAARTVNRLFSSRYLLYTNTVSCGLLMGLGDVTVQGLERTRGLQSGEYDWARTGRMSTLAFVMGPFNHYWYCFLDRLLPGARTATVAKKILMDQVFASPFFAFTFFMGSGTLEGQPVRESWRELREKFWDVYKADWTVWPAAQAFNFFVLPPQFRVVYVSAVTFCWNTFLSYMKHKDQEERISKSAASVPAST